ncbi:hypothetical protein [Synechococcus sp. GFB01]|uniref:hypothetical protein n=1 Tax=Synechococcus sp. GFB01 TaxID=1662190 RepID=UPI00064F1BC0|nr:hypothetical protein [Synechococcus sp. GFB01]KMM17382.1 hypothetical protein SYNGFB01_04420 [Synechococcus sp. GFB01]
MRCSPAGAATDHNAAALLIPPPPAGNHRPSWRHCDLTATTPTALAEAAALLPSGPQLWLSFSHLWLLAPFLSTLADHHPEALNGLRGIVACSSSSVVTKRFAWNPYDRALVKRLEGARLQLEQACLGLGVPACILAPTMIHGHCGDTSDRNVEALRRILRRLPLLPLPRHTGLRQPIAAGDLVAVALDRLKRLGSEAGSDGAAEGLVCQLLLGGDEQLSYRALLERIQTIDPGAARCRLIPLPNRLFQALAAPLLLMSPRHYEAVLRLSADLAGFATVADLLDRDARPFHPGPWL